jgi:predicted phosphodiesterase
LIRIAVFTDLHGNLPALKAVLKEICAQGCDAIFHTGDAIGIGPYPAESLAMLLSVPNIHCVVGNHDSYLVHGLPQPQPSWMSDGEVEHQLWTHGQLRSELGTIIREWPYRIEQDFEGVSTAFVHYGLAPSGCEFLPTVRRPRVEDLDRVFEYQAGQLIFYGHDHQSADSQGRARYVNPGSLGCCDEAVGRYCIVEFSRGSIKLRHCRAAYEDGELLAAFEQRKVPEREFIYRAFFGERFGKSNEGSAV